MAINNDYQERQQHQQQTRTDVLVTGGAGYVGSHCVLLLLEQNYGVVVIDNCSNAYLNVHEEEEQDDDKQQQLDDNGNILLESGNNKQNGASRNKPESLRRVERLAQRQLLAFYNVDLVDQAASARAFDEIFLKHRVRVVLHFAAFKSVNESIERPMEYYTNNLVGTINLLNAMKLHGCKRMIFSSSATVYGLPQYLPVDERHQVGQNILNPYGRTKFMIEQMLVDLCNPRAQTHAGSANGGSHWNVIALRYFNPVGAHPSGQIGEHTAGVPNNLMPYIAQVAIGKREKFYVFGDDFDTIDGTGVRDYIHIMDLASGHLCALAHLLKQDQDQDQEVAERGLQVFNLGTGKGYSVLETIRTFEEVNGVRIPYEVTERRQGDAGEVYADAQLALEKLGWRAKCSLVEMVRDTYRWQSSHPDGFKSAAAPGKTILGNNAE